MGQSGPQCGARKTLILADEHYYDDAGMFVNKDEFEELLHKGRIDTK